MTEIEAPQAEPQIVVGPGSPRGWRWFVSSRYPNMDISIVPGLPPTDTQRAVREVKEILKTAPKPDAFQGDGKLGSHNQSGTDKNDSPYWGISRAILDPGAEPEDGWTDDGKDIPRAERMTKEQKALNRSVIDHLRQTGFYQKTIQNNEVDRLMQLKELDWDPTPLSGTAKGVVSHGKRSIGKDALKEGGNRVEAPAWAAGTSPASRVTSLARPPKK